MKAMVKYFVVGFLIVKLSGFFISLFVLLAFSFVTGINVVSFLNIIILWIVGKVLFRRKKRRV